MLVSMASIRREHRDDRDLQHDLYKLSGYERFFHVLPLYFSLMIYSIVGAKKVIKYCMNRLNNYDKILLNNII